MRYYMQCFCRLISAMNNNSISYNKNFLFKPFFLKNKSFFAQFSGNGANQMPKSLIITPKALNQLQKIIKPGEFLRVIVDSGGCSGFEYKISIDKTINLDDEIIENNGIKVVVDKLSLEYIHGSKLDFTKDLMRESFRITDNPFATQGCSCGASFSTKSMN